MRMLITNTDVKSQDRAAIVGYTSIPCPTTYTHTHIPLPPKKAVRS